MTTEYSVQKMVSDGTLSTIALGIQYLQRNDIYVRIAGVETPQSGAHSGYTWSFINNTALKILPVVPNGVEVVVYRRTDVDAMYNIYSQNAQFDEATIDENNQQLLYIAQEYFEQGVPAQLIESVEYVHEDTINMYYRLKLSDGKYTTEFPIPKGGAAGFAALRRTYADAGLLLVAGSFETGGTLSSATDVLLHNVAAQAYAWTGAFPHVVAPGTDPTAVTGYVPHTDIVLRNELAGSGGAGLIGGLTKPVTWAGFAGGADPTGAAASDTALAAANAEGSSIYVPSGTFKITGNTDVSGCELLFEKGAVIDVQAGATLTVGRIWCGLHQVFSGAGSVVFTTNTVKAHPEWFGAARGINSTPALTKCMAACSPNKITTALIDEYFISDLVWDRRVPAEASPRSAFKPFGSAANGVKLTAGNSVGKNSFPAISGFPGYGIRIVGTSLANIYISEIQGCGDALILETSESATTLLDTEVTLTSISACDNAVVFVADKLTNVMQGNKVYCNFIANCENSVLFRNNGLASPGPDWDSNQVVTQAIDPTPSRASAVMLKNECPYAINRVVFRVETWAGGLASTGKFIEGRFNDLDAYINLANNPMAGQLDYVGASNRVDFSSARGRNTTPVTAVNASNSMPSFNGGAPLFHNVVKLKYIPSADWANNTQKQAYIYHQLTDQNTNAFTVQPPDSGSLRGTTVDSVIDNSLTVPYEIQINLRNVSGATITAGTEIEFKLRVGLY